MFDNGLTFIFMFMFFMFPIVMSVVILGVVLKFLKKKNNLQIKNLDKTTYYRDIPCYKNLNLAYWLLYNFSDLKKNELNNGLIGAYLLLWYKKGYIDIVSTGNSMFKDDNYKIELKNGNWNKNSFENNLYNFLKDVAGNNNTLEKNEIKNYCSIDGNSFQFNYLFKNLLEETETYLANNNLITITPAKNFIFFKTETQYTLSESLLNEYKNLLGLKNFLVDFSNIEDKRHIEVHIWEEYLLFANILGIQESVKKQLSKIYPSGNDMFSLNLGDFSTNNDILTTTYKASKIQLLILLGTSFFLFLLIFGNDIISRSAPIIFVFIIILALVYFPLKKHLVNKKVKEMNGKTSATIYDVETHYDTEYDYDLKRNITIKRYSFKYEYIVNGVKYTGFGYKKGGIAPWKGKKVKIVYNEMKPEKSETASEYNYNLKVVIVVISVLIIALFIACMN